MEGWLIKESRHTKAWRPRYTVLCGTTLSTHTEAALLLAKAEGMPVASERITLEGGFVSCVPVARARRPYVFAVCTSKRVFRFSCSSAEAREHWCLAINQVLLPANVFPWPAAAKSSSPDTVSVVESLTTVPSVGESLATVASTDDCFRMSSESSPTGSTDQAQHSAPLPLLTRFAPIKAEYSPAAYSPPLASSLDIERVERSSVEEANSPAVMRPVYAGAPHIGFLTAEPPPTGGALHAPIPIVARAPVAFPDDSLDDEGALPTAGSSRAIVKSSPLEAHVEAVFRRVVACEQPSESCSMM